MSVEPLPPESPLWELPNVVLTPHTAGGGGGDDKVEPIFQIIAGNLARFKAGKPLDKLVYGPATAKVPA
jgi:phosphoglycerate dehydrogenase-like enzyme